MDFGWPNVEISRKMANGQLLFLALILTNTTGISNYIIAGISSPLKCVVIMLLYTAVHINTLLYCVQCSHLIPTVDAMAAAQTTPPPAASSQPEPKC